MASPWEIDPTDPADRDGAGVDDNDDETTTTSLPPENPPSVEDSIRRLEERHRALKKDLDTMKIPSISKINLRNPAEVQEYINAAKRFIRARFPNPNAKFLEGIRFGTQEPNRLVVVGPKGGEQPIFKLDETGFMQSFIKK